MAGTTNLTRAELEAIFGKNPKAIRAFEEQQNAVAANTATGAKNVAATEALQDATVITLSANATLNNERVLEVGDGLTIDDQGPGQPIVLDTAYDLSFNGGYRVRFNLFADTNLSLPPSGTLATKDDVVGVVFPGPFADDTAAATGGVAINHAYRKTGGTLAWRVS